MTNPAQRGVVGGSNPVLGAALCFRWLLLFAFLPATVSSAQPAGSIAGGAEAAGAGGEVVTEGHVGASRYQRLVLSLAGARQALARQRFARVALGELAEIYLAEAGLARQQLQDRRGMAAHGGWTAEVERYVDDLLQILAQLSDPTVRVTLRQGHGLNGTPILVVGSRRLMLDHPRPGQQAAYEQAVLSGFCRQADCPALLEETPSGGAVIPLTAQPASILWAFTPTGPACSAERVTLRFPAGTPSGGTRALCEGFHGELARLRLELRWQRRKRVALDWRALALTPRAHAPGHLLRLNGDGDVALLPLPLLADHAPVLERVGRWFLEEQEEASSPLVINATELGWSAGE